MSKEAVEAIVGKAVVDGKFRATLFADPDRALLAALDERARMLGGTLAIRSQPGFGTRLTCRIPVGHLRGERRSASGSGGPEFLW